RFQVEEGRVQSETVIASHQDLGDLEGPGAARAAALRAPAPAPGGLIGARRRREQSMAHQEAPVARVIVLTCEDDYGVRDNQLVLLNRSGRALEELLADFKGATPGARSLCEEDFNEAFAAWASSQGYCGAVEWDEV